MVREVISILLPHFVDPENNNAFKVCMECLVDNTSLEYELLINTQAGDVYNICNKLARQASSPWLVFLNTDVFLAPGWDTAFLNAATENKIVTGVIVECGAIPVAAANVEKNFGLHPWNFDRESFEEWIAEKQPLPAGDGWYFPSMIYREAFLDLGGFDTDRGYFPEDPLDTYFWDTWKAAGNGISHVRSYSYHLQHYSSHTEQRKKARGVMWSSRQQ